MHDRLPGLNGLRAIAASIVLFAHVFQIAGFMGHQHSSVVYERYFQAISVDMVNLFFVISGFIITYLLLKEKSKTGTVSLFNFYIKRTLRIWPLYFGILVVVYVLQKYSGLYNDFSMITGNGLFTILFFIVTFSHFFQNATISVLPHYWSLSVEEQFYLFWPPIFKVLSKKGVLFFCISLIVGIVLIRNFVAYSYTHYSGYSVILKNISGLLKQSLFSSIAIGALGAWIVNYKVEIIQILFRPSVQIASWILFLLSIVSPFYIPYIHYEMFAFLYLIILLNLTQNPNSIVSLENRYFEKTGIISYGIYMYHWPLIPILVYGIKKAGLWEFFMQTHQVPLLLLSYGLTWGLAYLSFRYFETPFLRMKPQTPKQLNA